MKKGKLIICCGHGEYDPGAVNGEFNESVIVRALASAITLRCQDQSKLQLMDTSIDHYRHRTFRTIKLTPDDQVVELHMDGFGNKIAKGAHVIINSAFEPDRYDKDLAEKFATKLPGRADRIVKRSDVANCNDCASRGIAYRLLEVGFITNDSDLEYVRTHLTELADDILTTFEIPVKNTANSDYNEKLKRALNNAFGFVWNEMKE